MCDGVQCYLFVVVGDYYWWMRFLDRFRFEDRVLDVEISVVEGRMWFGPYL